MWFKYRLAWIFLAPCNTSLACLLSMMLENHGNRNGFILVAWIACWSDPFSFLCKNLADFCVLMGVKSFSIWLCFYESLQQGMPPMGCFVLIGATPSRCCPADELNGLLLWIQWMDFGCWLNGFRLTTCWFCGWSWSRLELDSGRSFVLRSNALSGCFTDVRRLPWSWLLKGNALFCRSAFRRFFLLSIIESAWQSAEASSEFWYWISGWSLVSVHTDWRVSWFSGSPSAYSV